MTDLVLFENKRLVNIEAAKQLLYEARDIQEVTSIRDYAEAVRLVARQAKAGLEVQNEAAEIKLRAERRAGEMLASIDRESGKQTSSADRTRYQETLEGAEIGRSSAHNWQRIASIPETEFEQHIESTKTRHKELTTAGIVRKAKELRQEQRRNAAIEKGKALTGLSSQCSIFHGDGMEYLWLKEKGSIDLIITDPPYPREYLPLFDELADASAHALKPGGSLLVLCGQSYMPEIMASMTPHLTYQWMLSYLTPGGQSVQLWQRQVNTFWKPVLWFVNGDYSGQWIGDVVKSAVNDNDKRFHEWGQSVSGMVDLVGRFAKSGNVIVDPFCGAGTTGIAALRHGCQFVGVDIDEEQVMIALGRLHDES